MLCYCRLQGWLVGLCSAPECYNCFNDGHNDLDIGEDDLLLSLDSNADGDDKAILLDEDKGIEKASGVKDDVEG